MDVLNLQQRLWTKSLNVEEFQFNDLSNLMYNKSWIKSALYSVLQNTGARTAGVDGLDKSKFIGKNGRISKKEVDVYANTLVQQWREGYKPSPVKRAFIPKGKKELRPLGIPTLKDRVYQMGILMFFEPIFDAKFSESSYGFRPQRNAIQCLRGICYALQGNYIVIEGDMKSYFDTVNHRILLEKISRRIKDKRVINDIAKMLKSGIVLENGLTQPTTEGTPQGGVLSPMLSNIYLDDFDKFITTLTSTGKAKSGKRRGAKASYFRYADDWIIISRDPDKVFAQKIKDVAINFLEGQELLKVNWEKTSLTPTTEGFEFLGFMCKSMSHKRQKKSEDGVRLGKKWKRQFHPIVIPRARAMNNFRQSIKHLTRARTQNTAEYVKIIELNRVIKGWGNYFRYAYSGKEQFLELDWYVGKRFLKWLKRKHGRKGYNYLRKRYYKRISGKNPSYALLKNFKFGKGAWHWFADDGNKGYPLYLLRQIDRIGFSKIDPPKGRPYVFNPPVMEGELPSYFSFAGHPSNWDTIRRTTFRRAKGRCENCNGRTKSLQAHREIYDNKMYVYALCPECHRKKEKIYKGRKI